MGKRSLIAEPTAEEKDILLSHRIARMASVDHSGKPLVIPVCFVYEGRFIYTPIDNKPKNASFSGLKRVKNVSTNPNVSLVIDVYFEDWYKLYYLIINGAANILNSGREYESSLRALCGKYEQYKKMGLEEAGLPVIKIVPERIISWGNPRQ